MRRKTYSVYEAKSKLSQAVREARAGYRVVVTVHGKEAVELTPIPEREPKETLDERIARLSREGAISPAKVSPRTPGLFPVIARKPGALKRFLASRD
jgi:prevent-host-death family protein